MISIALLKRIGIWVGAAIAILIVLVVLGQVATRGCSRVPDEPVTTTIDAGASEADRIQREIEAEARAAKRIREIESKHRDELKHFDSKQEQEYEAVKRRGPEAVADWLSKFNEELRRDTE